MKKKKKRRDLQNIFLRHCKMIWKKLWSRLLSLYWGWRRMFYKNTLPVFIRNKFIIRSLQIPVLSSNKGSKTKVFWHCCSAFFVEFVHVFVIEKSSRWMKKSRTCQIMNRKQVQEIRVKIILWLQRLNDEDLSHVLRMSWMRIHIQ